MVPREILEKVHEHFKTWTKFQISLELSQEFLPGNGQYWLILLALPTVALRTSLFCYINAAFIGIY